MIQIEDFGGEVTAMFMGKSYQEFAPALTNDSIVVVRGRVSMRDDGLNLHAFSLFSPDLGAAGGTGPVEISSPRCALRQLRSRRSTTYSFDTPATPRCD